MSSPRPFLSRWWPLVPLAAALFLVAADYGRIQHIERVNAVGREQSSEKNAATRHWLIVPEHNARSYQWLAETEQMLTRGEARVRRVDYENAPLGREVHAPSPYRWWLGGITGLLHASGHRSTSSAALETAALIAEPLLHLLALAGGTLFVARRFGARAAMIFSVGLAAMFPLASEFLPGVPDDRGLAVLCAGASVLLLLDGVQHRRATAFIFSGVAGGLGLWVGLGTQVPILIALALGGGVVVVREKFRGSAQPPPLPWNTWALAGAATSFVAYLVEYFPEGLELRLQVNHPLYAVAWIGLGLLLTLLETWRVLSWRWTARAWTMAVAGLFAVAALPVTMLLTKSPGFLIANPQASRATNLPNGGVARNLALWLHQDGQAWPVLATLLPFAIFFGAGFIMFRRESDRVFSAKLLIAGTVTFVTAAIACTQLQGWATAQLMLLIALICAAEKTVQRIKSSSFWGLTGACLLPGAILLVTSLPDRANQPLTRLEVEGLVERDLAHWLAAHQPQSDRAVVLAAPERTPGLWFYGGVRGLGSPNWENRAGVAATVNILGATTLDEAQALLERRGVTHLVLASWDTEMDEFVKWTKNNPADTFLAALHRWALPPWVQPVPYHLPQIGGFERQSVLVLKITADTDRALSLSRLAEYALEMEDAPLIAAVHDSLQAFPANLGALIGRAQIEKARNNPAGFEQIFATIRQTLATGADRLLPWDRRLSLAIVLVQGGQSELARAPLQRCVSELNEERIRSLGAASLYRLLVLTKALDAPIARSELRELALALLPADARARL